MLRLVSLCSLVAAVSAAPALVWSSERSESTVYTSDEVPVSDIFPPHNALTVVFLLGRGEKGSESLTTIAPKLSGVASKSANTVHSHVVGVESAFALTRTAGSLGHDALAMSLHELPSKFNATAEIELNGSISKRSKALAAANVLVVNVAAETEPTELDTAVVGALDVADHVVLTAVRSVQEVKKERDSHARRRLESQFHAGRHAVNRRLEEEDKDDQNDTSGIYFVQMTPNILAGVLFFGLFSVIIWTALSCMGMISGQDCYVSKYPSIGREA